MHNNGIAVGLVACNRDDVNCIRLKRLIEFGLIEESQEDGKAHCALHKALRRLSSLPEKSFTRFLISHHKLICSKFAGVEVESPGYQIRLMKYS